MSGTCRWHTTLSADFGDMACRCRYVADMLHRVLWVESVPDIGAPITSQPGGKPQQAQRCYFFSASIAPATKKIISCIYIQKLTATDQYWLSYGPASFAFKTSHRSIKLCRAISQSILVRCRRFLHVNAAYDFYYCWCNWGMTGNIRKQARRSIVVQQKICLVYTCSTLTFNRIWFY